MIDWFVIYKFKSAKNREIEVYMRQYNVAKSLAETEINKYKSSNSLYAGAIIARKKS